MTTTPKRGRQAKKVEESCYNCAYWWHQDQCRESSPQVGSYGLIGMWPETVCSQWCGKWRAKGATRKPAKAGAE
jgi:hypothetical protein